MASMRARSAPRFNTRARPIRLLIVTVALATIGVFVPAGRAGAAPGAYAALGDSYTAGPLIPNQLLNPLGCLRSDRNYPHRLAAAISRPLRDVSCSGATTNDLANPQGVTPGPNPPQYGALDTSVGIVTLQMGGNDIGFSSILQNCVALLPIGSVCKQKYVVGGVDTLAQRIDATAPKIAAAIAGIRSRAPAAHVFVVGYPTILPDTGGGCWPSMPVTPTDAAYLRGVHKKLNQMLATQATAAGATYVDLYGPSIGRDACTSASVRWVEPIFPGNAAAPVHPNAAGMAAFAGIVRTAMINAGAL